MRVHDDELEALLDRVPVLRGLPRTVVELPGGLTNQNLHVTTPAGDYVVRRFRGDGALLGIDRDAEHVNSLAAAEAGVGAGVVDYLPELGVLVIDFIDGRTYENATFAEPGVIERVAHACRKLHGGPRFTGDFDMFRRQARYRRTVAERGYRLFDGYDAFDGDFRRVQAALAVRQEPTVPCNNDLLAGNFVDDGDKLWLIDYEYSGNNDACFELGNTATECELDRDQVEALADGVLRARAAQPDRPRPAAVAGVAVRLGALGVHPGLGQQHRLRLRRVGPGAVREGRAHVHRSGVRAAAGGGVP